MKTIITIFFLSITFFANTTTAALLSEKTYQGHVYKFYSDRLTWSAAKDFAEDLGGYLVIVNNSSENNFIKTNVTGLSFSGSASDGGGAKYVWLGGSDSNVEGQWKWVDGTSVPRNNSTNKYWGDGAGHGAGGSEPDNFQNQDCLAIGLEGWPTFNPGFYGSKGQWNDIDCGNTLGFIVEVQEDNAQMIPDVPQQSLSRIIRTDGTATDSTISIGASSDGGETTDTTFTVDDEVTLTAKIYPDSGDVGEEGELYVVMRSTIDGKKTFSALNQDGNWEPWNASLKSLPAAKIVVSLQEVEDVLVYSGTITAGDRLFYVGYSLFTAEGKPVITTSLSPYKITVSE